MRSLLLQFPVERRDLASALRSRRLRPASSFPIFSADAGMAETMIRRNAPCVDSQGDLMMDQFIFV